MRDADARRTRLTPLGLVTGESLTQTLREGSARGLACVRSCRLRRRGVRVSVARVGMSSSKTDALGVVLKPHASKKAELGSAWEGRPGLGGRFSPVTVAPEEALARLLAEPSARAI